MVDILKIVHARSVKFELGIRVSDEEIYFKDHNKCREIESAITENIMNRMKAENLCDNMINNTTMHKLDSFLNNIIQSLQIKYGKMKVRTQQMMRPT